MDTSGLLFAEHLASGHAHDDHINAYWGTPTSGFRGILDYWQAALAGTPYSIQDYTFVDIGSGKGRVLMLASARALPSLPASTLSMGLGLLAGAEIASIPLAHAAPHTCTFVLVHGPGRGWSGGASPIA